MTYNLSALIARSAQTSPRKTALIYGSTAMTYAALDEAVYAFGAGLRAQGLQNQDRVAVYLPKQTETVVALFGIAAAGGVFVPVNPALKPLQLSYILKNCGVRFLVTSPDRMRACQAVLDDCPDLAMLIVTGRESGKPTNVDKKTIAYTLFLEQGRAGDKVSPPSAPDDLAAILYTSGSTGLPKGVMLSQRNLMVGAESVAGYLKNSPEDRILSVLPLSFDAGLSQLTTGFLAGATVVLMNYLLPRDVLTQMAKQAITGITLVPPLLLRLIDLPWPDAVAKNLRYLATTGGRMPVTATRRLRRMLPRSDIYLMYGLTEAFRSTYLPPSEIDRIPDSIGKAIPQAEIMVVRPDGSFCDVDEVGELVHAGPLVGMGYWQDPARTARRYRPLPGQGAAAAPPEMAVWSGDYVKRDADGYLYFVGRQDDMIKTSGYRTSPTEIEEIIHASGLADGVAALGMDDPLLGQAVWLVLTARPGKTLDMDAIMAYCRQNMPGYMVPQRLVIWPELPLNANGKVDRKTLAAALVQKQKEEDANKKTS